MILGIDASNIRSGGGATHLIELLRAAEPSVHGFDQVVVWGGQQILKRIESRSWLTKSHQPSLDRSLFSRTCWQRFQLCKLARDRGCDLLFVPGGSSVVAFRPMATMSRNLLPFEWQEMVRYGLTWQTLKCWVLRHSQSAGFRKADGVIFLTHYAQQAVTRVTGKLRAKIAIVPHGIDDRFKCAPRSQCMINKYSDTNPFRLLYVSIIDVYKHQWNVAESVASLRAEGLPIVLDFVGPAYRPALRRLQKVMHRLDPGYVAIRYLGAVSHAELGQKYRAADLLVFASSCENLPNILLEGMASGLPIACSNRGPMPEVLGNAGSYFDPEDTGSIAAAIRELIVSPELRARKSRAAFDMTTTYSWRLCATETFRLLADVARAPRH